MNLKKNSKRLRNNQTDAEYELWQHLRMRQILGIRFRRQVILKHYIVDFVAKALKLIIEVDGSQHMKNIIYDRKRTLTLNNLNYKVLRFWNNEVLEDIDAVMEIIYWEVKTRLKLPSPLQEEDF